MMWMAEVLVPNIMTVPKNVSSQISNIHISHPRSKLFEHTTISIPSHIAREYSCSSRTDSSRTDRTFGTNITDRTLWNLMETDGTEKSETRIYIFDVTTDN